MRQGVRIIYLLPGLSTNPSSNCIGFPGIKIDLSQAPAGMEKGFEAAKEELPDPLFRLPFP